jgi:hypothetical protein
LSGEGVRANGNPISGVPATGSGWPGEMPTGAVPTTTVRADALPDTAPYPSRTMPDERSHPGRLVFGLAMLAAERVRPGAGANPALLTGAGLVAQAAADAGALARRVLRPPTRMAAFTAAMAGSLPGADLPRRSLARSRDALRRVTDDARERGAATVAAGRADASAFLRTGVHDGITWAQHTGVPQMLDGLLPHLIDEVMPRLIDGALPEIRTRVLPIVIEDLTKDPRVHDLVMEQGRGVMGDAAQQLRASTATADERVESAFRRLVRSPVEEPPDHPTTRG